MRVASDELRHDPALTAALNGYEPTDEQWAAISHPLQPVHLVAGAGSGKTAVMAARIVWIVEHEGLAPSQVLGLTFTNKAAEELEERVRRALLAGGKHRPEDVVVRTYHAFADEIVRTDGLLVGVDPDSGLLSEAQQWQLVRGCLDELPAFQALEVRSPAALVRSTLALASSISDHLISTADVIAADQRVISSALANDDMRETSRRRMELCRVVEAYVQAKRRARRIDFGDQVTRAVEILESFPEVLRRYRELYPVTLLDEYQDTNVAQRRLVQALVGEGGAATAVGDARQAIYAWRGATMYNLIGFPAHFPRRDREAAYEPVSLRENFRSGRRILETANAIAAGIDPARRPGEELRPHPANGEGRVTLGLYRDGAEEAAAIADLIEQLHGHPMAPGRPPVAWKDIAVLLRRRSGFALIHQELSRRDIPVEVVGLTGLLKTPEVTEVVAWLRCLEGRPSANRWLARILLGPRWRIHHRDLALCARWIAERNHELALRLAGGDPERARELTPGELGVSLVEAVEHADRIEGLGPEARRRLRAFANRLAELRARAAGPLPELVRAVIDVSGVDAALQASTARSAPAQRQNLSNLLDLVASFAPLEDEANLRTFLDYLDAAEEADETLEAMQPADQDSVKIMTVHAAKGLEFECVFVPAIAASEGKEGKVLSIFPDTRTGNPLNNHALLPYEVREDRDHLPRFEGNVKAFHEEVKARTLEDERRLFYVALTRAKQFLHVSAAWWYERQTRRKGPSEFWEELEALSDGGPVEVLARAEPPASNPAVEALQAGVGWPPPASLGGDDLFPDGVGAVADALAEGRVSLSELAARLDPPARARLDPLLSEHAGTVDALVADMTDTGPVIPQLPETIAATTWVRLREGQLDPIDLVRPLPERPSAARRLGTEIHRLIEESVRGIAPYPDEGELDAPGEVADGGRVADLLERWRKRYGGRTVAVLPSGEPMVELPFALRKGDHIVRGRIDVVYETDDGGLEIVDLKTGRPFDPRDHPGQLALYAEALNALGLVIDPERLRLTYEFLDDDDTADETA